MRLIDADTLNFEKLQDTNGEAVPANEYIAFLKGAIAAEELIKNAPTIDAEPVVHGHWIDQDSDCEDWHIHQYECSKCGMGDQHNPNINVPYCWFCGAKMDEVQE